MHRILPAIVFLSACGGELVSIEGEPEPDPIEREPGYHVAIGQHTWRLDLPKIQACVDRPLITRLGGVACAEGDSHAAGAVCPGGGCLEQAACKVHEVRQDNDETTEYQVPRCPLSLWADDSHCGEQCPCWRLISSSCNGSPYAFEILRSEVPEAAATYLECEVAEPDWGSEELGSLPACW